MTLSRNLQCSSSWGGDGCKSWATLLQQQWVLYSAFSNLLCVCHPLDMQLVVSAVSALEGEDSNSRMILFHFLDPHVRTSWKRQRDHSDFLHMLIVLTILPSLLRIHLDCYWYLLLIQYPHLPSVCLPQMLREVSLVVTFSCSLSLTTVCSDCLG